MQAIFFELILLHVLQESTSFIKILFVSKLVRCHDQGSGHIHFGIRGGIRIVVVRIQAAKRPVHESMVIRTGLVERPKFIELRLIAGRVVAEVDHHQHAVAGPFRHEIIAALVFFDCGIVTAFLILVRQVKFKSLLQLRRSFCLTRKDNAVPAIIGILREREIHRSLRQAKSKEASEARFYPTIHKHSLPRCAATP